MAPDSVTPAPDIAKSAIGQRIRKARSRLPATYGADRQALNRRINRIRRLKPGSGYQASAENRLAHLEQALDASVKRRIWRQQHCPKAVYPETGLPILAKKCEIISAIKKNQVLIISGETGSGKTTQIPKFCLDAGQGIDGIIGCTQPRRIAATTVARRIAEELGESFGKSVGYKIRFRDKTAPNGFIKIMTDGILLAEIQADFFLNQYDTLIVDEAHERSLNIDLTLGIVKQLLSRRRDLKLIVTSATIDTGKFSRVFNDAPVIEVSGRMYPVQVRYEVPSPGTGDLDATPVDMAVDAVVKIERKNRDGDILVFMPTEQDIRDTCRLLKGRCDQRTIIFPLFARLTGPEQSKVFAQVSGRKIIVATNVAETSITIPGIKYVVDTGLARIPRYTPRSRCTLLPIDPISRSSADQRKGRCGRVADGVCVRLYSEEDYLSRPLFTSPEILRSNLADVILRMIALRLGDVADFPFIDPPSSKMIQDGYQLLLELNAIIPASATRKTGNARHRYRLTVDGKLMVRLPIDPRLSRMLIEAHRRGCVAEIVIIAAALSIRDPRERPLEMQKEADRVHAAWADPASDFITLLNIWRWFEAKLAVGKGTRKMKRFCRDHFLAYRRMREWKDVHRQLCTVLKESGIAVGPLPGADVLAPQDKKEFSPRYAAVHQSILSGFLSTIACKKEKNRYTAARGREVTIFPGSGLFNRAGQWIVAAEMVLTSQLFARIVANIDPDWLEPLAGDMCKSTFLNPHWDRHKETVMGIEQVSLFGLVIVPGRPVVFGRIDAEKAGDIFIEDALVAGDLLKPLPFVSHNQRRVETALGLENRLRRRDLFVGDPVLADFYRRRLKGIWNIRLLRRKIRKAGGDRFLRMKLKDLVRYQPDDDVLAAYPETIRLGSGRYPCVYAYEPGGPEDGISVRIPAGAAASVPAGTVEWLVPGLIGEKIRALVKGLPKTIRRQLGPIPQVMEKIENEMPDPENGETLINVLGRFIYRCFGVHVPAGAWPVGSLPDYLKMRIVITDTRGKEIRSSRNPAILHETVSPDTDRQLFNLLRKKWEQSGITRWDFGKIPTVVERAEPAGAILVAYPGLVAEKGTPDRVGLRLFSRWEPAITAHLAGVKKLAILHLAKEMKFLKKSLKVSGPTASKATSFGGVGEVERQVLEKVTEMLFAKNIRTGEAFRACLNAARPRLHQTGQALMSAVEPVVEAFYDIRTGLNGLAGRHMAHSSIHQFIGRRQDDLDRLVPRNFIALYDPDRLERLPLYIRAILIRTQRAVVDLEKDHRKAEIIRPFSEHLDIMLSTLSPATSAAKRHAIESYFWLLEAFKVSVFAQELKAPQPVSARRLEEKIAEIDRMT